ncbi:putative HAM1-protein [Violaceomyces palustris]|uniref:HAM1-protein n=1 Tax=Violaceomyces palustris TaxID=1673888 RepID=A0ACD0P187_9BASI|nr:putative HAM1-protein [Violaceomyces palustris]
MVQQTTQRQKPKLVFVTGNANKLKEVREILSSSPFFPFLLTNQDLDLDEIQGTTREVAEAKCSAASERLGGPCITEDTALGFDALEGLPGPYIKHFLKSLGHSGLNRLLDGFQDRSAQAICTFAYSPGPGQPVVLFEGITRGTIVQPRGPPIFGWDPVFEVQGTGLTYAEMPLEQKNLLSHRYKALSLLQDYLCKLGSSS